MNELTKDAELEDPFPEEPGDELILLKECGMSENEADDFINRLCAIAYHTEHSVYTLASVYAQISYKKIACWEEFTMFLSMGIPIYHIAFNLFPAEFIKTELQLTPSQIIECIISMTDEGGMYYKP